MKRNGSMVHRTALLSSLTAAVAAHDPDAIQHAAREARAAGASVEELLRALEFAWRLARVPGSLVAFAYEAIQAGFVADNGAASARHGSLIRPDTVPVSGRYQFDNGSPREIFCAACCGAALDTSHPWHAPCFPDTPQHPAYRLWEPRWVKGFAQ